MSNDIQQPNQSMVNSKINWARFNLLVLLTSLISFPIELLAHWLFFPSTKLPPNFVLDTILWFVLPIMIGCWAMVLSIGQHPPTQTQEKRVIWVAFGLTFILTVVVQTTTLFTGLPETRDFSGFTDTPLANYLLRFGITAAKSILVCLFCLQLLFNPWVKSQVWRTG